MLTNDLKNEYEKIKEENNILKFKLKKIEEKESYLKSLTSSYLDKLDFSISFLTYLNTYTNTTNDKPGIYGSFLRKIFEFPYLISDYLNKDKIDELYANFKIGDIDFYISSISDPYRYNKILTKIVKHLNLQLGFFLKTNNNEFQPKFGSYYYIGCKNTSEYLNLDLEDAGYSKRLYFNNEKETFYIDLTSCISQNCFDFSVNNLTMNSDGFKTNNKIDFLQYLNQIKNKSTFISSYSFKIIEDNVWNHAPILRNEKEKNLNKHIQFINKRLLKILEKGYKIEGRNFPEIEIETKEDCSITNVKAPYPKITLKCGHSLSLMVYNGLVNKGMLDYSQSIRCPMCRENLEMKLICTEIKPLFQNKLNEYRLIGENSCKIYPDETINLSYKNLSQDCLEVLNEIKNE